MFLVKTAAQVYFFKFGPPLYIRVLYANAHDKPQVRKDSSWRTSVKVTVLLPDHTHCGKSDFIVDF